MGDQIVGTDQTMVRFDTFLTSVRDGSILNKNNFGLLSYDKKGNVVTVWYNGSLLTMVTFCDETRWSECVESMQKDVECTFGILKGK